MNELDKLIERLITKKGGSRKDYLRLLKSISFHESAGTNDPTIKQHGGGPGRGKYQFEEGIDAGGITAVRRTFTYYKDNKIPVPEWLAKAVKNDSLDATKLSSEQQDILFLGNMKGHPKANFSKIWSGETTIEDFWADYHWAGDKKDRPSRINSFRNSMTVNGYYTNPTTEIKDLKAGRIPRDERYEASVKIDVTRVLKPRLSSAQESIFEYGENTIKAPINARGNMENLISYIKNQGKNTQEEEQVNPTEQSYAYGGSMGGGYNDINLNSFEEGGTHEQNPHGGIPMGIGQNGKMNTVEQGEASYDFEDGKYIFSNRF